RLRRCAILGGVSIPAALVPEPYCGTVLRELS
ncbi:MAG: hypothetical protein ACJAZN_003022, partial [Planctomycetota bacterium]